MFDLAGGGLFELIVFVCSYDLVNVSVQLVLLNEGGSEEDTLVTMGNCLYSCNTNYNI